MGYKDSEKRRIDNARKRKVIQELKNVPCADCKRIFSPECMDFDHVNGEKHFTIARVGAHGLPRLLEEIKKCDVVCACCHRTRTKNRRMAKR